MGDQVCQSFRSETYRDRHGDTLAVDTDRLLDGSSEPLAGYEYFLPRNPGEEGHKLLAAKPSNDALPTQIGPQNADFTLQGFVPEFVAVGVRVFTRVAFDGSMPPNFALEV